MDSVRRPLAYPPVAKETISSERAADAHISMTAPKAKHVAILFTLISQRVGHNTGDASDPLYAGTARAIASSLRTGSRSCGSCSARGGSGGCRGATSRRSYMALPSKLFAYVCRPFRTMHRRHSLHPDEEVWSTRRRHVAAQRCQWQLGQERGQAPDSMIAERTAPNTSASWSPTSLFRGSNCSARACIKR